MVRKNDIRGIEQLLTYGLHEGKLVHVSQVENGLGCNCVCPNCKHPLIAKNNPHNKKAAHFAHSSGTECAGAVETALHLLAKDILKKTKKINAPSYHHDYNPDNWDSVFRESKNITFDNVLLEQQLLAGNEKIIPDAIAVIRGKKILVEFANTHFIDHEKKAKIKLLGLACIEVNLQGQLLNEASLTAFLNTDSGKKYWITNPRLDNEYLVHQQKQAETRQLQIEKRVPRHDLILGRPDRKPKSAKELEAERKLKQYKGHKEYKLLTVKDGRVQHCPLEKKALTGLKNSWLYSHDVLRKIIDGDNWNGIIYGKPPNGKWIYVGTLRVVVYPPRTKQDLTNEEAEKGRLLYAGLRKIQELRDKPEIGNCASCSFSHDYFDFDNTGYEVCRHQ